MPMPRWLGSVQVMSWPPMATVPSQTSTSPAMLCSKVDLPQPEGPSRTRNSPSATSRSSPWMISVAPKRMRKFRMLTLATALSFDGAGGDAAHEPAS